MKCDSFERNVIWIIYFPLKNKNKLRLGERRKKARGSSKTEKPRRTVVLNSLYFGTKALGHSFIYLLAHLQHLASTCSTLLALLFYTPSLTSERVRLEDACPPKSWPIKVEKKYKKKCK